MKKLMRNDFQVLIIEESDQDISRIMQELDQEDIRFEYIKLASEEEITVGSKHRNCDLVIANSNSYNCERIRAMEITDKNRMKAPFIFVSKNLDEELTVTSINVNERDYVFEDEMMKLKPAVEKVLNEKNWKDNPQSLKNRILTNKSRYQMLFDESPVPLLEVDISGIQAFISFLKNNNVKDFKAYFDNNPDAAETCLSVIKILDMSSATLELFNAATKKEIIEHPSVIFDKNSINHFKDLVIQLFEGNFKFKRELRIRTLSGEEKIVILKLTILPEHEKDFSRALLSLTDISEQKKAEHELKIKDIAFQSSLYGIGIEDLSGKLTYVNQAMLDMWGYSREDEILGTYGIKYWQSKKRAKRVIDEILRHGKWVGELVGIRKDGSPFDVRVNATLITDDRGEPSLYMGTFEEITKRKQIENAIKEREAIFHSLFMKNQGVILLIDVKDKNLPIIDANEAAIEYYGYSREQLLNMTIMDLNTLPPEKVREQMAKGRMENKNIFEFKHRLANGEIRNVETYSGPIDVYGRKLVYVVIQDISERKKMEGALQESEEHFRSIFKLAPVGIALVGLDHTIAKANHVYCKTLGFDETELKRMKIADHTHPYDRDHVNQLQQKLLSREISEFEIEKRFIKRDGNVVCGILRASLIRNYNGDPQYFLVQISDITGRKKAEEALRESEERYKSLAHESPNAILVHSQGRVVYVNHEAMKILKIKSEEECLGKPFLAFVHPDFRQLTQKRTKHLEVKKTPVSLIEEKFIRRDGKVIDVEVAGARVIYHGKPASQIVFRDITFRKRAEKIQELVYNISNAVLMTQDLNELFKAIEYELSNVLDTQNFSISLYDRSTDMISLEFYKSEKDDFKMFPAGKTLTGYVIKHEKPMLLTREKIQRMVKEGKIKTNPSQIKIWLGVPLKAKNEVIGVIAVQSYDDETAFGIEELEILKFTSDQIGLSIEKKQAEERLKSSLEEKVVLLKEIHHRVKNNLQIISSLLYLQSKNVNEQNTLAIFRESQNRVRSMSLVHEKLYQSNNLAKIDVKQYIEDLVRYLYRSYSVDQLKIKAVLEIKKMNLSIDSVIPCGLIINELVSNALKYAFPESKEGEVKIIFKKRKPDTFKLIVSDNGIGVKKEILGHKRKTLGLQLVETLASQLGGTININTDYGTEFQICFRDKNAEKDKQHS